MSDARSMPAAAAAATTGFLSGDNIADEDERAERRDSDGTPVGVSDAEEDRRRAERQSEEADS